MSDFDTPQRYSLSGNIGGGLTVIPVLGVPVAIAAAFVEGSANYLVTTLTTIPVKLTSLILLAIAFGLGYGLGYVVAVASRRAKCRSAAFVAFASIVLAGAAVYGSWGVFCWEFWNNTPPVLNPPVSLIDVLQAPSALWGQYSAIWASWSVGVGIVATAEMLTLGITPVVIATTMFRKKIFCESCKRWIEPNADPILRAFPTADLELQKRLKMGDLEAVRLLPKAEMLPMLRIDTTLCDGCQTMGTYRILRLDFQSENPKPKETDLSGHILINAENAPALAELHKSTPPESQIPPPALSVT